MLLVDLDPQANATSGLGERANGMSTHDLLDGMPLPTLARPTAFRQPRPRPGEAGARAAQRSSSRPATAASAISPTRSRGVARDYCVRVPRLPAVVRAADGQRARRSRPRDRARAGRVLRARGAVAAARTRSTSSSGGSTRASAVAGILLTMVDGRTRLRPRSRASCAATSASLVFTTSVPRSVRLAEAPSHGLPAIAYDRRSAGAQAYWKVAMELVERP